MPNFCGLAVEDLRKTMLLSRSLYTIEQLVYTRPVLKVGTYTTAIAQLNHGFSAAKPFKLTEAAADLYTQSTGPITRAIFFKPLFINY